MDTWFDYDALTLAGGRVVLSAIGTTRTSGHDIPHPIGDPDEDEGLPGDDDEDEDNDDDDDEEPMQVRRAGHGPILHRSTKSVFLV